MDCFKLTSLLSTTVETGEEQEKTYFSGKAKLFQFTNKEWKERGIGTFKVNVKVTDGQEDKKAARMIMRADGVLRVMLNSPLFKGMKVGDPSGNEPQSKQIHLVGVEDGRTVPLLLRVRHSSTSAHRNIVADITLGGK
jgi:Ran-binding protein 3